MGRADHVPGRDREHASGDQPDDEPRADEPRAGDLDLDGVDGVDGVERDERDDRRRAARGSRRKGRPASSAPRMRSASRPRPPHRRRPKRRSRTGRSVVPSGRAVIGGLLVAASAVVTFGLASRGEASATIGVVVATNAVRAGTPLTTDNVTVRQVPRGAAEGVADPAAVIGRISAIDLLPGQPVPRTALRTPDVPAAGFEVTIPLPPERALGAADADRGQLVDVIATVDGCTRLVGRAELAGSGAVGGGTSAVRLRFATRDEVLAVVHANATGQVTLARPLPDEVPDASAGASGGSTDVAVTVLGDCATAAVAPAAVPRTATSEPSEVQP